MIRSPLWIKRAGHGRQLLRRGGCLFQGFCTLVVLLLAQIRLVISLRLRFALFSTGNRKYGTGNEKRNKEIQELFRIKGFYLNSGKGNIFVSSCTKTV